MSYYEIRAIGTKSVTIYVSSDEPYFRVYVRYSYSAEATVFDRRYTNGVHNLTIPLPEAGTEYVINVGTGSVDGGSVTWIGAETFTTENEPEPESSCYIWTGSGAVPATPYIWNGSGWQKLLEEIIGR